MAIRKPINNIASRNTADAYFNVAMQTNKGLKQVGGLPLSMQKELHRFLIENADQIDKATFVVDIHVVNKELEEQELAFA